MDEAHRKAEREGRDTPKRLRELQRRGELTEIRLRLAATLGYPPAREALGVEEPFVPFANPSDLVSALTPFGEQALLRAASLLLSDQERIFKTLGGQKRRAITVLFTEERRAIDAYLEGPCEETREDLEMVASRAFSEPLGYVRQIAKRHDLYGSSDAQLLNKRLTQALVDWALAGVPT